MGLIVISLSTMTFATQYSTYIINTDDERGGSEDITIDYTICSNALAKNPTCSEHISQRISWNSPHKITLNSQTEVLYIWRASKYVFGGSYIESNYTRELQGTNEKPLTISNCAATSSNMITLNSYNTRDRIGCQVLPAA